MRASNAEVVPHPSILSSWFAYPGPQSTTQVNRAGVAVAGAKRESSNGHPRPVWTLAAPWSAPRGQLHLWEYPRMWLPVEKSLGETQLWLSHPLRLKVYHFPPLCLNPCLKFSTYHLIALQWCKPGRKDFNSNKTKIKKVMAEQPAVLMVWLFVIS